MQTTFSNSCALFVLVAVGCQAGNDEPSPGAERAPLLALSQQSTLSVSELTVVASARAYFPYLERKIETFKVVDDAGNVYGVSVDEDGAPIELDGLREEEEAARSERHGALDESVVQALAEGAKDVRVMLWVRTPALVAPKRPEPSLEPYNPEVAEKVYAAMDEERAATLAEFLQPAIERIRKFDAEALVDPLSPAIAATLSAEAVAELARDPNVERIYAAGEVRPELDMAKATTGVDTLHFAGLSGRGVRVAIIEAGGAIAEPNSFLLAPFVQDRTFTCGGPIPHATSVAGVFKERRVNLFGAVVGEVGITPSAELFVGGDCATNTIPMQLSSSRAANWGASAINLSWGHDTTHRLGPLDRFYDDMVRNRGRTIVKSAGNGNPGPGCQVNDGILTSPATAYNVISVGGIDDRNTPNRGDDVMDPCSSFANPISLHGDRQKPELVAPAVNVTLVTTGWANLTPVSGTSVAAPQVAAAAALFIEKNGTFAFWPEITRALVMATARNIEGASASSDQDGAGALMTAAAADLIGDPNRWGGKLYSCLTPNGIGGPPMSTDLMTVSVGRRTRQRVALAWDADPAVSGYGSEPSVDLDLVVVDNLGRAVAASRSFDGTNEIVEFDSWVGGTFTLRAQQFRCMSSTWLGWAWSTSSSAIKLP